MFHVVRGLLALLLLAASPAMAAFTLANNNGGDGYVVPGVRPGTFTLFGAGNQPDLDGRDNLTTYGTTAAGSRLYVIRWSHVTEDEKADWDPGGWFVNDQFVPLTNDDVTTGVVQRGRLDIAVRRGDVWGFYVYTTDGCCGRGALTVTTVPEPASWALLVAGFGGIGAAMRRRRLAATP